MPIIKQNQMTEIKSRPIFTVLYGEPGSSKTTISLTSTNPILLDFDRGYDRAGLIKDTFSITKGWDEVLSLEKEIMAYDTIIIDTAKAALDDVIAEFVIKEDYKNKKSNGALSLAGYGAMGEAFKSWNNRYRQAGKDIIVIAHAKDEKEGDTIIKYPDITGGSYALLMRLADQVGYVHIANKQRMIRFTPTDKNIGKDTAMLSTISVPDLADPKFTNFMAEVIQRTKDKIMDRTRILSKTTSVVSEFETFIKQATEIGQFNAAVTQVAAMDKNSQLICRKMLTEAAAKAGLVYSKANSSYELINNTADAIA